jgi:hypothetical protein
MTAQQPSSGRPGREAHDWLDVVIEWASGATAVGMFAYGYALSYAVLHAIAAAAGLAPWAARVWPLGFESFMASAALNALAEQRHRRHLAEWRQRVPWYPWTLTGLTAGASLLLNWFHPAIPLDPPPEWLRSLVYGLPPLAAVFAWHLFLQRIAHRRHRAAADAKAGPVLVPAAGEDATTGVVPTPDPATTEAAPGLVPAAAVGDGAGAGSSRARRTSRSRPTGAGTGAGAGVSAERARTVAAAFQAEHGRPISRDALGRALHVSNRVAGELLRAVRAAAPAAAPADRDRAPVPTTGDGDGPGPAPAPVPASSPAQAGPAGVRASSPPARNGTGPRPDAAPPAPSSPSRMPARVP